MLAIGESSGNVSISPWGWGVVRAADGKPIAWLFERRTPGKPEGRCPADVSNHIVAFSSWHLRSILNWTGRSDRRHSPCLSPIYQR